MTRKEELEALISFARKELSDIQFQEYREANKEYVGKCFKFRNSYSCPKLDTDYWWSYFKIVSIDEHGNLKALCFETASDKAVHVHNNYYINITDEYIPITSTEFDLNWDNTISNLVLLNSERQDENLDEK